MKNCVSQLLQATIILSVSSSVLGCGASGEASEESPGQVSQDVQAPTTNLVNITRGFRYQSCQGDHFLTIDPNGPGRYGYVSDGVIGQCWTNAGNDGRVPVYQLSNGSSIDHLYTTNYSEASNAVNRLGFHFDTSGGVASGILCYVYPGNTLYTGLSPLSRFYQGGCLTEHIYSVTDITHYGTEAYNLYWVKTGFSYEGITGYMYSSQNPH